MPTHVRYAAAGSFGVTSLSTDNAAARTGPSAGATMSLDAGIGADDWHGLYAELSGGTNYGYSQVFYQFDLSSIPAGSYAGQLVLGSTSGRGRAQPAENNVAYEQAWASAATAAWVDAADFGSLTPIGTSVYVGRHSAAIFPSDAPITSRSSAYKLMATSAALRDAVTPTNTTFSTLVAGSGATIDLQRPRIVVYEPPAAYVRATGASASGTGAISPGVPAGTVAGDILLMVVETANQAATTPSGWALVLTAVGTGTAAGTTATRASLFWKRAGSSESAPTVADPGDHAVAQIIAIAGCVASGTPFEAATADVAATATTAVACPSITTLGDERLVVSIVASATDSTNSPIQVMANASLVNPTMVCTVGASDGNGGGFGVFTGVKETAGSTGAATGTLAASSVQSRITLAMIPEGAPSTPSVSPANGTHGHTATSPTLAAKSTVAPNSASHGHSATSPSIAAKSSITPASASHGVTSTSPELIIHAVVPVDDATHGQAATSPSVAAASAVAVDDAVHGQEATAPSLVPGFGVSVDDTLHGHAAASPTLSAWSSVQPDDASHAQEASSPTLAAASVLAPEDSTHAHGATSPDLAAGSAISVNDASHAQAATEPALTAHAPTGSVQPDDAAHGHTATAASVAAYSAVEVDAAVHGHAASEPNLVASSAIQPDAAAHETTASSPALATNAAIQPLSATHGHFAASPTLTPGWAVLVNPAAHLHIATSPSLSAMLALPVPPERRVVLARTRRLAAILAADRSVDAATGERRVTVDSATRRITLSARSRRIVF